MDWAVLPSNQKKHTQKETFEDFLFGVFTDGGWCYKGKGGC